MGSEPQGLFQRLKDIFQPKANTGVERSFFQQVKDIFKSETITAVQIVPVENDWGIRDPAVKELVLKLIGAGLGVAVSALVMSYMVEYLDPTYAQRKAAKKRAQVIMKELNINEKGMDLSKHEMEIAAQLVSSQATGVGWEDVGGCEELIKQMQDSVILPLKLNSNSDLFLPPKGVLLYGPPGCGKTLLAKAIAKAAGAHFINLQASSLQDKWYGESQKLAAAVFSLAQKLSPSIIFLDEIDSFLRARQSHDHEATAMMKAQFMSLWDGFATTSRARIVVMGATNRPNDVDRAILRRMPCRFHVKMPNKQQRKSILEVVLRDEKLDPEVNLEEVAEETRGLSGSDLREVCRLAVLRKTKDLIEEGIEITSDEADDAELTQEHLKLAAAIFNASVQSTKLFDDHNLQQEDFPVD